jgi:predicted acyltransferase
MLGVNALALFFLSTVVARFLLLIRVGGESASLHALLFDRVFAPLASPVNASPAYAIAYVLVWWVNMWMFYGATSSCVCR